MFILLDKKKVKDKNVLGKKIILIETLYIPEFTINNKQNINNKYKNNNNK